MEACLEKWSYKAADVTVPAAPILIKSWGTSREPDPLRGQGVSAGELRFGAWRLVPRARLLLRAGQPVELGSRAYDLLHILLCRRGFVVEKNAIVSFVWPNTIVEESNLRFQVAALRKVLGEDSVLIKTIPGRGYIFAAAYEPTR